MKQPRFSVWIPVLLSGLIVSATLASDEPSEKELEPPTSDAARTEFERQAAGEFDVTLAPLALDGPADDGSFARMSIVKTFHGPLAAVGRGQMLTARTDVAGSAAYVAIERVTGTLDGRSGSFALHHRGVMDRGEPSLDVAVVPDSGTGELVGLAGNLEIEVEGDVHRYELRYTLPAN